MEEIKRASRKNLVKLFNLFWKKQDAVNKAVDQDFDNYAEALEKVEKKIPSVQYDKGNSALVVTIEKEETR